MAEPMAPDDDDRVVQVEDNDPESLAGDDVTFDADAPDDDDSEQAGGA